MKDGYRCEDCIYYKDQIPLIKWDHNCTLGDCLVTEFHSQGEKCYLTYLCFSPCHSHDEFYNFCTTFD